MIHDEFRTYAKLCKEQSNVLFEYDKEVAEARQKQINDNVDDLDNTERRQESTEPCINLVQKILKNTPESANELFQLLLDFKFNSSETRFEKVEEGIGEKE